MKKIIFWVIIFFNAIILKADFIDEMTYDSGSMKRSENFGTIKYVKMNEENKKVILSVEYKNGARNGKIKSFYEDGTPMIEGTYLDDKKSGNWKFFYPNGTMIKSVFYNNGFVTGEVREYYEDGKTLYSIATYDKNKKNGREEIYYSDSENLPFGLENKFYLKQKISAVNNYKDGILMDSTIFYKNKNTYMSRKRINEKDEDICYFYDNGKKFLTGTITNGKPSNEWICYNKNGDIISKGMAEEVIAESIEIFRDNEQKLIKYEVIKYKE